MAKKFANRRKVKTTIRKVETVTVKPIEVRKPRMDKRKKPKWYFGGFTVGKLGNLSEKQFIESNYKVNQSNIERYYRKQMINMKDEERTAFTKRYGSAKELWISNIKDYQRRTGSGIVESMKHIIQVKFGEVENRLANNALEGLKSAGLFEQLKALVKPNIVKAENLRYLGGGIYGYMDDSGEIIAKYTVLNSPMQLIPLEV